MMLRPLVSPEQTLSMVRIISSGECHSTTLRMASRRVSLFYDNALEPTNLKMTQFSTLSILARGEAKGSSIQALASALVMDRSTFGQHLRPLERDGYVVAMVDVLDRRCRRVTLTKRGRLKYAEAVPYWERAQAHFEQRYGTHAMQGLRSQLVEIACDPAHALRS